MHDNVRHIVRSLKAPGFARLLIVNGQGGNVDALGAIARELAVEYAFPVVAATQWYFAEDELRQIFDSRFEGRHACEGETSIMMAISPDTVRVDLFEYAMRQHPSPVEGRAKFARFYSLAERAPLSGITGDPRTATAAKGEGFLEIQASELAAGIMDDALWTAPDPVWHAQRGQGTVTGIYGSDATEDGGALEISCRPRKIEP